MKNIFKKFVDNNKKVIGKYVTDDSLPLDVRRVNVVYIVGAFSATFGLILRIILGSSIYVNLIVGSIIVFVTVWFYLGNYLKWYKFMRIGAVVGLCFFLFPLAYFILGGVESGMPAYFVLSIAIIFALLKGWARILSFLGHLAVIISCYILGYYFPNLVQPMSTLSPEVEHLQSLITCGICVGMLIAFQNFLFENAHAKTEEYALYVSKQNEAVNTLNEAANTLLTATPETILTVLNEHTLTFRKVINIENVYIFQFDHHNPKLYLHTRYYYSSRGFLFPDSYIGEEATVLLFKNWYETLMKGNPIQYYVEDMNEQEQAFFNLRNVKAFFMIPVFINGMFWGMSSFAYTKKINILDSGDKQNLLTLSSLYVNAIIRNDLTISEREAKDIALKSAQAKSDFLANMSHEIRTPMNAIKGMTELAKKSDEPEKLAYYLERVTDASNHLSGVINDILDMSKIEANKYILSLVDFDFDDMVNKVVSVLEYRFMEKHQTLTTYMDVDIPSMLVGDDIRLAQILTNLLSNAIKFTEDYKSISLRIEKSNEDNEMVEIKVIVQDSGIGISEKQQSKLFSSFQQADNSTSRKFGGTGLGLSISKGLVELMNGKIWVESKENIGSKFIFTAQLAKSKKESKKKLNGDVAWQKKKVLTIFDDSNFAYYMKEINKKYALNITPLIPLAVDTSQVYDIVFIDYLIEETLQNTIISKLKKTNEKIKVVSILTLAEWNNIKDSNIYNQFLPKPVFYKQIIMILNSSFSHMIIKDDINNNVPQENEFQGFRILLVEDIAINREIVMALLETTKLEIDVAENGQEAIEKYKENYKKYSLIFMDLQMPILDGYGATKGIREFELNKNAYTPIIAMTANVFKEDIDKCLEVGMNGHIGKPINIEEVAKTIRQYTSKRQR
ncbi:MAG: response regulator [Bacillales bacterium]|jgi:signal transduction histidine kinase/CheY-like chemotaxis protein|nr:response regulator [Bacillales bacterium]